MCMQKETCYKELAHAVMEADKSKICSVGWQPGGPEKLMFQFQSKAQWAGDPGELLVQLQSEGSLQDSIQRLIKAL